MSSIEPSNSGNQMNRAGEIASGFVISRGNAAVLLESGEEVFDQMASFVQMFVVVALILTRAARWNHDFFARLIQRLYDSKLCVVGLVDDDRARLRVFEQHVCAV